MDVGLGWTSFGLPPWSTSVVGRSLEINMSDGFGGGSCCGMCVSSVFLIKSPALGHYVYFPWGRCEDTQTLASSVGLRKNSRFPTTERAESWVTHLFTQPICAGVGIQAHGPQTIHNLLGATGIQIGKLILG